MSTAAKQNIDWKAYEQDRPKLGIRVSRDEKNALDTVLRQRGETISGLLMGYLRPIITEGTPEGQRAHQIISAAVQASIAWNREHHNGGFGDTEPVRDESGHPVTAEWQDPAIVVRPRVTPSGHRVNYHMVTQRAGMTRQDAVRKYVSILMDAWADLPESRRDEYLAELGNPDRHRFVIALSGFQHWTRFPDAHEMRLHWTFHQLPNITTPADDGELRFATWATALLADRWDASRKRRGKSESFTLIEGHQDADTGTVMGRRFSYYPINTDAENVETWAGLWLNDYRGFRRQGLDHESAMNIMAGQKITIQMMTISDT